MCVCPYNSPATPPLVQTDLHGSGALHGPTELLANLATEPSIILRYHGSLNVPIEHHPAIRYMVYNGYYKVMSNIPKMGQLPTPVVWYGIVWFGMVWYTLWLFNIAMV